MKDIHKYEPQTGDIRIKQAHKFNYLTTEITAYGKNVTEFQMPMGIVKVFFEKFDRILRNTKMKDY